MVIGDFYRLINNGRVEKHGLGEYKCFGNNTSTIIHRRGENDDVIVGATFKPHAQEVFSDLIFELGIIRISDKKAYRWINPQYKEAYLTESKELDIDPTQAFEDIIYIDVETTDEFIKQARLILTTRPQELQ